MKIEFFISKIHNLDIPLDIKYLLFATVDNMQIASTSVSEMPNFSVSEGSSFKDYLKHLSDDESFQENYEDFEPSEANEYYYRCSKMSYEYYNKIYEEVIY